jgi:predicted ATPase
MITRIKIKGFKSLLDIDLELGPLTVLFGPNATGKSNLLDALMLLSRIISVPDINEAFSFPYRGGLIESFSFNANNQYDMANKNESKIELELSFSLKQKEILDLDPDVHPNLYKPSGIGPYGHSVTFPVGPIPLFYHERDMEKLEFIYKIEILLNNKQIPFAEIKKENLYFVNSIHIDKKLGFEIKENKEKNNIYKIKDINFLQKEERELSLSSNESLLHHMGNNSDYIYIHALKKIIYSWKFYNFQTALLRNKGKLIKTQRLDPVKQNIVEFLYNLKTTRKKVFNSIEKTINSLIPSIKGINFKVRENEIEILALENEREVPWALLSEGTLRVLAILAIGVQQDYTTLIGLEEPENGIHPGRIRQIAEFLETKRFLGQTQYIVTTHSPILPDQLPKECLVACKKKNGYTVFERLEGLASSSGEEGAELEPTTLEDRILRGDFDE